MRCRPFHTMPSLTDIYTTVAGSYIAYVTLFLVAVVVLLSYTNKPKKHYKLPPGPFSLPLVGTLPFLGKDIREPLRNLSKDYGDVVRVYFGSRLVIVLNSYAAIKEAFVRQGNVMAGRPQDILFIKEIQLGLGIVSSEGEPWKQNRKLVHTILRDFGVGSTYMEERILSEAEHFKDLVSKNMHTPWDLMFSIQAAVANIIFSICYGNRNEYDDPWYINYMDMINRSFELLTNVDALAVFPMLKYLPGDIFGYKELMKLAVETRTNLYRKKVKERMTTYEEGTTNDFMDAYLHVMFKEQKSGNDTELSGNQLACVISDLLGAGTETTTSTLRWGLLFMLHHPEIQRKVQQEIDEVIGKEQPSMQYRQKMPYTEACLCEVQRLGDVVPLGLPHSTLDDMQIFGYDIPEGTMVVSNLYSVHHDSTLWPDPLTFNPERFLDDDGTLHRSEKLIPFSMGKRVCIGESLARMELFMFFVIMLQNFTFEVPKDHDLPSKIGRAGITHMPKPFKVMVLPRT